MRYYRSLSTVSEKRAFYATLDWKDEYGIVRIRGRRRPHHLPDIYDDIPITRQKTWKKKRRTQYRVEPRGERHEIFVDSIKYQRPYYRYEEYFKKHDIPFRIENESEWTIRWSHMFEQHRYFSVLRGYRVIWWSNKDIGIDLV